MTNIYSDLELEEGDLNSIGELIALHRNIKFLSSSKSDKSYDYSLEFKDGEKTFQILFNGELFTVTYKKEAFLSFQVELKTNGENNINSSAFLSESSDGGNLKTAAAIVEAIKWAH